MRLLKIRIFSKIFQSLQKVPSVVDIFKNRMAVNKSRIDPLSQFSALRDFLKSVVFLS